MTHYWTYFMCLLRSPTLEYFLSHWEHSKVCRKKQNIFLVIWILKFLHICQTLSIITIPNLYVCPKLNIYNRIFYYSCKWCIYTGLGIRSFAQNRSSKKNKRANQVSANEKIFICKGKHCLQTCKDDKKSFKIFAGNLGNILRGTVPKYRKSRRLDDTIGFEKLTRPVGQKTLFSVGLK